MAKIAKMIQYITLKMMKKFGRPDDERPAMAAADHLIDRLLPKVFQFFKDPKFRQAIEFDKMDTQEQDRVFNELEVAVMSLALFCLEQREGLIGNRDFHFWKNVQEQLPIQFEKKFLEMGVDEKNAELFKKLILMRHEEYGKIMEESRPHLEQHEEFRKEENLPKNDLLRIQAVSMGAVDHILRGKLEAGHPVAQIFINWIISMDVVIIKFMKRL